MQLFARELWGETRWGLPTSVALHLAIAFLLLFRLPEEPPRPPEERNINVELVPPPKPEERPPQKRDKSTAERPRSQPQALESASAKPNREKPAPQLPPAAPKGIEGARPSETSPPQPSQTAGDARPALAELRADTEQTDKAPSVEKSSDAASALREASAGDKKPLPKVEKMDNAPEPAGVKLERQSSELVAARELYSEDSLSDPHVRQAIGQLPPKKRILQLCSIEALEQVRRQRPGAYPDMLVPYGPSGGFISKSALKANGGAFRSQAKWYDIDFRCEVDTDKLSVVSFSFAIGNLVPSDQWNARRLPTN
ncbi:DUF930 domain-containing protein [Sinorhizobium numidicum]|uniref:DUF930 domain-containing protein n=1 Tax=Sinorhizobium numidicum TaxID=680248 RepID=A0ABY8CV56_9HYPH|nr:DUF930 domain-containing protein [Sinorhizobium numidicum]WEX74617.1 DUF930 domain-containing protein [Sinorhizobium numidicum]WEX80608.1 DUF930 domain-containing protein [Sinorhizobium numidicum]